MSRLISIALRNVLRNKRRSLFSGAAMIIGVAVVVFLDGFFNGFIDGVIKSSIEGTVGAVQVHRAGFLGARTDPLKLDMPGDAAFMARLKIDGVEAIAPRINFEGLVNNGSVANLAIGTAIDPKVEYVVCPGRKKLEVDGTIAEGATDSLVIGAELAKSMDLSAGSSVSVLSATQRGVSNALDATVRGRIESPVPFASKRTMLVPLSFAQSLLKMPGRVTEYALRITDVSRARDVQARLAAELGPEYEVLTWEERDPAAVQFAGRLRAIVTIVKVVLFVLVLTFIVNAVLAAVYERVREIGTMLAVGVRRSQVLSMFLIEAMTLGFAASTIGSFIGAAVVSYYARVGILLQPPGTKPTLLYPFLAGSSVAAAIAISVIGAVVAALYPAFKASRLRPVEALRAN